jgi:hypothetical protein
MSVANYPVAEKNCFGKSSCLYFFLSCVCESHTLLSPPGELGDETRPPAWRFVEEFL